MPLVGGRGRGWRHRGEATRPASVRAGAGRPAAGGVPVAVGRRAAVAFGPRGPPCRRIDQRHRRLRGRDPLDRARGPPRPGGRLGVAGLRPGLRLRRPPLRHHSRPGGQGPGRAGPPPGCGPRRLPPPLRPRLPDARAARAGRRHLAHPGTRHRRPGGRVRRRAHRLARAGGAGPAARMVRRAPGWARSPPSTCSPCSRTWPWRPVGATSSTTWPGPARPGPTARRRRRRWAPWAPWPATGGPWAARPRPRATAWWWPIPISPGMARPGSGSATSPSPATSTSTAPPWSGCPASSSGATARWRWTHTFSVGKRFTLYRLELDPTDPTRYRRPGADGGFEAMVPTEVTVAVRGEGGEVADNHPHPVAKPPGPCSTSRCSGGRPRSASPTATPTTTPAASCRSGRPWRRPADLDQSSRRPSATEHGIPWVTTEAADRDGRTWYVDASHTPGPLPRGRCLVRRTGSATTRSTALLDRNRIALLEEVRAGLRVGDRPPGRPTPDCSPSTPCPSWSGPTGFCNANESHWLANPAEPLTGYPPLLGAEKGEDPSAPHPGQPGGAGVPRGRGPPAASPSRTSAQRVFANRSVTAAALPRRGWPSGWPPPGR